MAGNRSLARASFSCPVTPGATDAGPRTRVLIVDDSPTMRRLIASVLRSDRGIEVVGEAGDPFEARQAVKALNPDVITLDVEMPGMNGIAFLERLMRLRPTPVVMVSTLTGRGSATAVEALGLGAIDCVGKPVNLAAGEVFPDLVDKVRAAGRVPRARLLGRGAGQQVQGGAQDAPRRSAYRPGDRIVVLGASTGGVDAIGTILAGFPERCPPTLIVQHMPPGFTRSFAARLSQCCAPRVEEARDGAPIEPGIVYLAPGAEKHLQIAPGTTARCRMVDGPPAGGHRPSVDWLFRSAVPLRDRAVGVILTGMGSDGAAGLREMRAAGAMTIGQDEATSIVYGMPRVARETGAVSSQLPLGVIARRVLDQCSASSGDER